MVLIQWLYCQANEPLPMNLLERIVKHRLFHLAILLIWCAVLLRRLVLYYPVTFDDAWMYIRYADHLLAGQGYSWNPGGPPTFGCTSIAYTFWISGLKGLLGAWVPDELLLLGSSLGFFLLGTGLLMELSYRWAGAKLGWPRSQVYALVALLLFNSSWFYHGNTGMETTLAICANAVFFWALIKLAETPTDRQRWVLVVGLAYFCFLVRPDVGFFILLTPAILLRWAYQWPWPRVLGLTGLLVAVLALDTLGKTLYFGSPLPLPYAVKKLGFYEGAIFWFYNPYAYLEQFARLILPLVTISLVTARSSFQWGMIFGIYLPLLLTVAVLLQSIPIMGEEARFFVPLLPWVLLGAAAALKIGISVPLGQNGAVRAFLVAGYAAVAIGILPFLAARWEAHRKSEEASVTAERTNEAGHLYPEGRPLLDQLAMEINQLPPEVCLTGTEHGYLGAQVPLHPILDLTGLHTPELSSGAEVPALLIREKPGLIWMPINSYTVMHQRIRREVLADTAYLYFPQAYVYGLAIRRDLIPLLQERGAFPELLKVVPLSPAHENTD